MRNALSIARGAASGSRNDANTVSTSAFTLIRPRPSVTGSISTNTRRTAVSRQSNAIRSAPGAPAQPRQREHHLHDRPDQRRPGVDEQGLVGVVDRHREHQAAGDHEVPQHRRDGRHEELAERVQDRLHDPGEPEQHHGRHQDPRQLHRQVRDGPVVEDAEQRLGEQHRDRGDRREAEERRASRPSMRPATRALARPCSSSSLKTGMKAAPSAASATSERTTLGICEATVNWLIAPRTPNTYAAEDLPQQADDTGEPGGEGEQRSRPRLAPPPSIAGHATGRGRGALW